jgi:hypothetical protein
VKYRKMPRKHLLETAEVRYARTIGEHKGNIQLQQKDWLSGLGTDYFPQLKHLAGV